MCGILFLNNDTNNISDIFSAIKYRGPDTTTIKSINNLIFCHHRLSIINVTGGEQPFIREIDDNKIVLIANGEIYNYKSLTTSPNDCEAIIDCYLNNQLHMLDGDFAFVLYDQKNQLLITGRDPVGLKPLYIGYSESGSEIAFASEMKVLSGIENVNFVKEHEINTFNKYTIDKEIKFYESYNCLNYNQLIIEQTYENALKNVNLHLTNAVKKRITHTSRPYAFLCSGGIDSVIVVSIAAQLGIPLHVFMLSLENSNSYDEIYGDMFMNDIMKRFKIQYTKVKFNIEQGLNIIEEVVKNLETYDPNTIRAAIPMYILAKYIRDNTDYKVILSGEGSDELFMGYNYFSVKNPTYEQAEKESIRLIQGLHSFDILRAERCFSCHGLELRVPFLDRDLINTVIQISGKHRLPINGIEKKLLRDAFANLEIPERILNRQKERMSDGIGFTWVPSLINHCVSKFNVDNLDTSQRMKYEKEYYLNVYKKYYKYDTILFRELPSWAENNNGNNLLIN